MAKTQTHCSRSGSSAPGSSSFHWAAERACPTRYYDSGITTALFKLEPGAVVPLHEHTALEQTYVIEGSLEDQECKCGPGQFVWRPAGNQHEAVAPSGAVLLGFLLKPNRFAYGEKFFTAPGER